MKIKSSKIGVKKKRFARLLKSIKSTVDVYDDLYFTSKIRNSSVFCRKFENSNDKIGIDFAASYSGEHLNFYYLIDRLPRDLYIGFKERLRGECRGDVTITFINRMKRHVIQWDSQRMKSKLATLNEVSNDNKNDEVTAYNIHSKISSVSNQSWIDASLFYLADVDKQRGRGLLQCSMTMIISGTRGEDFDESVKQIEMYSRHNGIGAMRILYDIHDLLRVISPFSHSYNKNVVDRVPSQVLPDEIVARLSSYTQGTIGELGVVIGIDVNSLKPLIKKIKITTESAENWLITAETGGGKSYAVKALLLQLLGLNYNGTIMDIEGFEYIPFANFMSHGSRVQILNMAEGTGKYFDPVEIHDRIGVEDIDIAAKKMSFDFTLAIFKTLLGRAYNEDVWLENVINDAVAELYTQAGVTDDMATWDNSKGKTLFDVYAALKGLRGFRESVAYSSALDMAEAVLGKYFEPTGTRAGIFKNRVNVGDIVDADLLVCSFGMAGKSPQSIDQTQLALMQMTAAQISHQRSIFSKSKGKYNFKLWEEFQRWGKFPDSDKTLGVALTGGRKLGDVNLVITNVVRDLLADDRFGLFGNITSFMCGAIRDNAVRAEFCDRMSIPNMKVELDMIAAAVVEQEDEESSKGSDVVSGAISSPYSYGFLCGLDKSKYGVAKVVLPEDLSNSDLFRTGINLKV